MLNNVQLNQTGNYAVLVTNAFGLILSSKATLTVNPAIPPSITSQPTNQTVFVGGSATFSVMATGSLPLSCQWNFNGTNIAAATNTTLTLPNVQFMQAGSYVVLVTNLFGSILSSNALLTVFLRCWCRMAASNWARSTIGRPVETLTIALSILIMFTRVCTERKLARWERPVPFPKHLPQLLDRCIWFLAGSIATEKLPMSSPSRGTAPHSSISKILAPPSGPTFNSRPAPRPPIRC